MLALHPALGSKLANLPASAAAMQLERQHGELKRSYRHDSPLFLWPSSIASDGSF
jgi:hypothetical protein